MLYGLTSLLSSNMIIKALMGLFLLEGQDSLCGQGNTKLNKQDNFN